VDDLRKAAQAVVERWDTPSWKDVPATAIYIEALRQALAQPEQEPVAWMKEEWYVDDVGLQNTREVLYGYEVYGGKPLYTTPPKRDWQGLTVEEILDLLPSTEWKADVTLIFAKAIEAKLKEKNT
jgi:hypothetical protein